MLGDLLPRHDRSFRSTGLHVNQLSTALSYNAVHNNSIDIGRFAESHYRNDRVVVCGGQHAHTVGGIEYNYIGFLPDLDAPDLSIQTEAPGTSDSGDVEGVFGGIPDIPCGKFTRRRNVGVVLDSCQV
ncbi:hypothetical protein NW767_009376 [Fusarium falciforme]|nr:hypothetical protein NW767_009376 [Fusarium falciforme]